MARAKTAPIKKPSTLVAPTAEDIFWFLAVIWAR